MWVVVDHLRGTRRGQRQELELDERLAIGRHPDCEVSFDTRRDLEASTRHAEIRSRESEVVLVDIGSSNGTHIEGQRVSERILPAGESVEVEFGEGGPRLRIWWDPELPPSAAGPLSKQRPRVGVIASAVLGAACALAVVLYLLW